MIKAKKWEKIIVIVWLLLMSFSIWILFDFGSGLGLFSMLIGFIPFALAIIIGYLVEVKEDNMTEVNKYDS